MKLKFSSLITAGLITLGIAGFSYLRLPLEQSNAQAGLHLSPSTSPLRHLIAQSGNPAVPLVHPDEPLQDTLTQRFPVKTALTRIQQIDAALTNFRQVTEKSKAAAKVSNTDWETQDLSFRNWVGSVEGTLRQQDYQIKKLTLELAQRQYDNSEISQAALEKITQDYQKSKGEFSKFLTSLKITE
ncbi:MAG: hypothetical protein VKJ46_14380 [Leptolyngbyaceae bacterium]|nr:hypothetical protein [Leptolyngbyaceae bacterium]